MAGDLLGLVLLDGGARGQQIVIVLEGQLNGLVQGDLYGPLPLGKYRPWGDKAKLTCGASNNYSQPNRWTATTYPMLQGMPPVRGVNRPRGQPYLKSRQDEVAHPVSRGGRTKLCVITSARLPRSWHRSNRLVYISSHLFNPVTRLRDRHEGSARTSETLRHSDDNEHLHTYGKVVRMILPEPKTPSSRASKRGGNRGATVVPAPTTKDLRLQRNLQSSFEFCTSLNSTPPPPPSSYISPRSL